MSAPPLVLVTGASGFIATHLVQQLLAKGEAKVRGTVRSLSSKEKIQPLYDLEPNAKYPLELVEADLNNEGSWKEAVSGCSYVYHVASPFPSNVPNHEDDIIKPAVNGTLNVLRAVVTAGSVKRVVLTSSIAAITGLEEGRTIYTEEDWAPVEGDIGAYQKSKVLAEKAAWDFLKSLEASEKFELAVVNPSIVIGPLLSLGTKDSTSNGSVLKLLGGAVPSLVDVSFSLVDVRDVAAAHIAAMEVPEAAGNRHIIAASTLSMKEMATIISEEFSPQGYRIPSFVMPKFGVWVYKMFDPTARLIYPLIGKVNTYANERMRNVLNIQPKDTAESIIQTCYNLIEMGLVPKKPGYRKPPEANSESDNSQLEPSGVSTDGQLVGEAVEGHEKKQEDEITTQPS